MNAPQPKPWILEIAPYIPGKSTTDDGRKVTTELFRQLMLDEMPKIKAYLGDEAWAAGKYQEAAQLFDQMCTGDYVEFLTLPAYERITRDLTDSKTAIAA